MRMPFTIVSTCNWRFRVYNDGSFVIWVKIISKHRINRFVTLGFFSSVVHSNRPVNFSSNSPRPKFIRFIWPSIWTRSVSSVWPQLLMNVWSLSPEVLNRTETIPRWIYSNWSSRIWERNFSIISIVIGNWSITLMPWRTSNIPKQIANFDANVEIGTPYDVWQSSKGHGSSLSGLLHRLLAHLDEADLDEVLTSLATTIEEHHHANLLVAATLYELAGDYPSSVQICSNYISQLILDRQCRSVPITSANWSSIVSADLFQLHQPTDPRSSPHPLRHPPRSSTILLNAFRSIRRPMENIRTIRNTFFSWTFIPSSISISALANRNGLFSSSNSWNCSPMAKILTKINVLDNSSPPIDRWVVDILSLHYEHEHWSRASSCNNSFHTYVWPRSKLICWWFNKVSRPRWPKKKEINTNTFVEQRRKIWFIWPNLLTCNRNRLHVRSCDRSIGSVNRRISTIMITICPFISSFFFIDKDRHQKWSIECDRTH